MKRPTWECEPSGRSERKSGTRFALRSTPMVASRSRLGIVRFDCVRVSIAL